VDKYPPAQFTFVGDPAALPDAFYDALAGLLLSIPDQETNHAESENKRPEKSSSRPEQTSADLDNERGEL